jgi:hypothetical protein
VVPTQPPVLWLTRAFSPLVKRPGREADHSSPPYAEVKNEWSFISTPYSFMACTGTLLFTFFTLNYSRVLTEYITEKYGGRGGKPLLILENICTRSYPDVFFKRKKCMQSVQKPRSASSTQAIVHSALGTTDFNSTIFFRTAVSADRCFSRSCFG